MDPQNKERKEVIKADKVKKLKKPTVIEDKSKDLAKESSIFCTRSLALLDTDGQGLLSKSMVPLSMASNIPFSIMRSKVDTLPAQNGGTPLSSI
uniref:Uncharacterized protein n=1 Tax=Solanum lycopersicum TaxID=4081 RepID=A0A3Q7HFD3_SOLLC